MTARYDEVISAFFEGLEHARDAGRDLSAIASVATLTLPNVSVAVAVRVKLLSFRAVTARVNQFQPVTSIDVTNEAYHPLASLPAARSSRESLSKIAAPPPFARELASRRSPPGT